jgi:membrane-anchored glycerophosphoryl diester phosphodiesterase (GDPDase)
MYINLRIKDLLLEKPLLEQFRLKYEQIKYLLDIDTSMLFTLYQTSLASLTLSGLPPANFTKDNLRELFNLKSR